ncbi:MAG TPA: universal stress protein [Gaiellaceae bacterium]|nr:universal stress protein [Gaiellaceae bacterium]
MISRIVVGYDGNESARRALDRAIEEAQKARAVLVVIAVAEMPLNPEGPQNFGTLDDSPARMIPLTEPPELEPILAEAKNRVEEAGLTADYTWAAGEPADAIVGEARDRGAELIVIGSHHHSRFARIFGPDVATQVKRDAGCDVIVAD